MTKKEADLFLEELSKYGSVPGLDSIINLCDRLGNPQDDLKFVHIAGTNGKGSVLKLVSDSLMGCGIKTGRYISPTITDYRERFQINGRMIGTKRLYEYFDRIKLVCEEMVEEGLPHPTAFEVETALAFLYFKEENCEIVVLETGMGGELDATNLVTTTLVSVICSVSRDHMAFLGNTLSEIAAHKAGIIKKGATVVCYPSNEEVIDVLRKKAEKCDISSEEFIVVNNEDISQIKYSLGKQSFSYKTHKIMKLALNGRHQIINASVALEVLDALQKKGYAIKDSAVRKTFMEAVWPGRLEVLAKSPLFVIDGAHNADAAQHLAESIELYFTNKKIIYIMGVLRDKEWNVILEKTHFYASHIITVKTPNNERAMEAYELAKEAGQYHNSVTCADSLTEAVEIAYLLADKDSVILAFGSLSYLGELRQIVASFAQKKKKNGTKA